MENSGIRPQGRETLTLSQIQVAPGITEGLQESNIVGNNMQENGYQEIEEHEMDVLMPVIADCFERCDSTLSSGSVLSAGSNSSSVSGMNVNYISPE